MKAHPRLRKSQRSTKRQQRFAANKAFRIYAMQQQREWDRRWGSRDDPMTKYTLFGKELRPQRNILKWGRWFQENRRTGKSIGFDYIDEAKSIYVSTVFLGVDHNFERLFAPDAPPITFETMIFGGEYDHSMFRYVTWDEARAAHVRIVEQLRSGGLLALALDELGIGYD